MELDYNKLEILLNHGLDPNVIPSAQSIRNIPDDRLPEALRGIKKNYPSILRQVRDAITRNKQELAKAQEILKKGEFKDMGASKPNDNKHKDEIQTKYLERFYKVKLKFLIKIDQLLVQKGARV